ncbi:hypothetical protein RU98_GL002464 [Enterococcus caccae]|nr:hypothetical protein RU98_GL002464 [Enterococcus caccae]
MLELEIGVFLPFQIDKKNRWVLQHPFSISKMTMIIKTIL